MRSRLPDISASPKANSAVQDFESVAGPLFTALQQHPVPLMVSEARAPDHPILFVNEAFERLTGYGQREVVGRSHGLLYGPDTEQEAVGRIETALREARKVEVELLYYRKDGSSYRTSVSVIPVSVDPQTTYFVSVLTGFAAKQTSSEDALRASQKQLAEANERLRVTLSLTGAAAAWEWHIGQNRIVGDPRFAALYGIKSEEAALGVSPNVFFSIIHPDDQPRVRLAIGGILRGAEVFCKEFRILLANHSVRWVQARGRCQYDQEDRPTRFSGVLIDITEQKLAAERLRIAQSAGGIGTFEHIEGFATATVSTQFCNLLGLQPASDLPVHTINSVVHPDDTPLIVSSGRSEGGETHAELRIIRPDTGEVRWLAKRGECLRDADTAGLRFSGVLIDITEQKLAAERLRIAQSAGGIGTFEHIEGFATATVSTQFCNLLGLQPASDLPVHTINSVVHPDDTPLIVSSGRTEGGETHAELRIIRPDTGEVRWLAKRGECLRDADTAGLRFSGVIYDITESKRIEERLRTLNDTLETRVEERTRERDGIWQLSKDLLGIADANGVWQSVNPAWTRVLGWQASEIVGRTSEWLQHPDDKEQVRVPFDAREGAGLSFQNRLRTRQGDYRSLAWTAVPQAGLFYCVARDVTEQLRREDSLARAEEQLRQAHKMEAVGQLTGGIAHDFNNMLTGVIASLGLIQRRIKAGRSDGLDEFIEAGMNSASRAATLTHSLLAFARRQSLDIKSQDINALISGIQEIVSRPLGENIALELTLAPDLWPALTDANQFENALLNLALNARDAMPEGGRITIGTANARLEVPTPVHDGEIAAGDYVVVSVSDTGVGMGTDIIAKAFEPFFTTKPIGQGTGLGLSMIYGFVKQSGGHVRITSDVGRGTTVRIYLRRALAAEKHAPAEREAPMRQSQGETILVVEDDDSVRFTVTELLKELGYAYLEAADAAAAIPYLQSDRRIDLMVTDVGLPNMDGRQLAEVGRQHRSALKVLFISGYSEKAAVRGGFLGPGMQMLGKPFTVDALSAKIRELIES